MRGYVCCCEREEYVSFVFSVLPTFCSLFFALLEGKEAPAQRVCSVRFLICSSMRITRGPHRASGFCSFCYSYDLCSHILEFLRDREVVC